MRVPRVAEEPRFGLLDVLPSGLPNPGIRAGRVLSFLRHPDSRLHSLGSDERYFDRALVLRVVAFRRGDSPQVTQFGARATHHL
jgi:hypothetical protein